MKLDNIKYVDSHCHLDLYKNYDEVIADAKKKNVLIVAVTNLPSIYSQEIKLINDDNVIVALGLHPQLVNEHKGQLGLFLDLLPKAKFIGEIGLDYQMAKGQDDQREIFGKILTESSKYKNKILSIHSRRSSEDVVKMVGSNFPGHIILHWYSGSNSTLRKALSNGYFFSINSAMLNSASGKSIIDLLPLDRILTETDAPFVNINNKVAMPSDVAIVIEYLAKVHGKNEQEVSDHIKNNFVKMLED